MAATCKGLKKDGQPCGMRPATGQDFCLNHGGTKPEKKPAAQTGGAAETAGKGAAASPAARGGEGGAVALGVAVGLACVAGLLYAAVRLIRKAQSAAPVRALHAVGE